ncbi:MAG TPA: hypothetical protein V6D29_25385 [Leptolyngbyaceae cyanobacterium]
MARRGWVSDKEFPGDSEERRDFALKLREGLEPQGVFEDWGDYNNDYPNYKHDQANSRANQRDGNKLGCSSLQEVQVYYDQGNSADIDIQLLGES